MITINAIELPVSGLEALQTEALHEGFLFIERLRTEWENGKNRFNISGEKLLGCMDQGTIIAIGGLNQDPFESRGCIGRIRRVYVRPGWRKKGIGRTLVETLVENARARFTSLDLRTDNPAAARLYERIGFTRTDALNSTHVLSFNQSAGAA
jgi:GNAT superfamily N-acetyltransferase